MSDASRQERAFLRYLYQDDPIKLASETAALQRQMDADFYSEWWCTSNNAKCNRLIAMEADDVGSAASVLVHV